jgi:hypothetical protein
MASTLGRRGGVAWSAIAGVVSAAAFLAVAELVALIVAREGSPILAVGSFVIDIVPQPLKELAISTFGAFDKIALLIGLALAVLVASAIAGMLELRLPFAGVAAMGVAGALSLAAIVTRAGATPLSAVPPLVGAVAGGVLIFVLVRRVRAWHRRRAMPPRIPTVAPSSA